MLEAMRDLLLKKDESLKSISLSCIHYTICNAFYSLKTVRLERSTMNDEINKLKRCQFAMQLEEYQNNMDYIAYFDETNFNLYLS